MLLAGALLILAPLSLAAESPECVEIRGKAEKIRAEIDDVAAQIARCETLPCVEKLRERLLKLSKIEDELMKKFEKECL